MDRNTLFLILAGLAVVIIILLWPKQPPPEPIVVEGEYGQWEVSLSPVPKLPIATSRPLIEYPNAALTHTLTKAPSELEEQASKAVPRPLIEYSNSALSIGLEEPEVQPVTLPRPLVEYAHSGVTLSLEPLTSVDLSQVQPRPLVEYADGAWTMSLSLPVGLLQGAGKP